MPRGRSPDGVRAASRPTPAGVGGPIGRAGWRKLGRCGRRRCPWESGPGGRGEARGDMGRGGRRPSERGASPLSPGTFLGHDPRPPGIAVTHRAPAAGLGFERAAQPRAGCSARRGGRETASPVARGPPSCSLPGLARPRGFSAAPGPSLLYFICLWHIPAVFQEGFVRGGARPGWNPVCDGCVSEGFPGSSARPDGFKAVLCHMALVLGSMSAGQWEQLQGTLVCFLRVEK